MKKRNLIYAIISGTLMAQAMLPWGHWFFAWIGLVPLFIAIKNTRFPHSAIYGFITGTIYFGAILYWITLFGYLPWILLSIYQGLFICFFSIVASVFLQTNAGLINHLGVASAWSSIQFLRTLGVYALPWGSFAHTQAENLHIAYLASVFGPWGIDFLICFFASFIAGLFSSPEKSKNFVHAALIAALLLAVITFVHLSLTQVENGDGIKYRVAIIQGNIHHNIKTEENYDNYALEIYSRMSLKASIYNPDLIVWPETTILQPEYVNSRNSILGTLACYTNANYLVGFYDYSKNNGNLNIYNSAAFLNRKGMRIGIYRKVHLVPFGEFVPLRNYLPFLSNYGVRPDDISPGTSHKPIKTELGKVGISICFESLFPQISRIQARNGANLLVIITNDSWFEKSPAAHQHLMMARLRAIENRRYVVRAASTGESAIIDEKGRIEEKLGIFQRGIIKGDVITYNNLSPYTKYGDWFAYLCCLVAAVLLLIEWRKAKFAPCAKV